ncbi:MAG: choline-responsive transcriptional repressor BetI [Paracoccaceae bacterium]
MGARMDAAIRREALVRAAIAEVGAVGSLDVTVADIARRAGVSAALAHHYFGSKDALFLAAMRRILRDFAALVRAGYAEARTPRARLDAIVGASFDPGQFDRTVVSAWLAFYVMAQRSPAAARLLAIYQRRLDSNLVFALKALAPAAEARRIAGGVGAMIDGFYIRAALATAGVDREEAARAVLRHIDLGLAAGGAAHHAPHGTSA